MFEIDMVKSNLIHQNPLAPLKGGTRTSIEVKPLSRGWGSIEDCSLIHNNSWYKA
jgi:hypothetical protein